MIKAFNCVALSAALDELKKIVAKNEVNGQKTVIFCEDRLSLAAERTVCAEIGGSFLVRVYTFARFLSSEKGKNPNLLSSQGSAMAVRKIIEENKDGLTLFKKLSASAAAQSVYDTIALLYSSRITAEQTAAAAERGGILGGKLKDIALIYSAYEKYLEESGKEDRNGYLAKLGQVIEESEKIKGNAVVFLGFQSLTTAAVECARAAFTSAADVYGLFIGGAEDLYVNEACAKFVAAAKDFGGAEIEEVAGSLNGEAEILRKHIFNPESFYAQAVPSSRVHLIEAADGQDELEFIAARIKKHVEEEDEKYAKISVMLPDLDGGVRALSRVFSAYKIPFYADRRLPLSEHPLCAFIINYLLCVLSGCRPQDVDAVISSPYFPAEREQKDVFRNYMLRLANWRGGVKREPSDEIADSFKFDKTIVKNVRKTFLEGLSQISEKCVKSGICGGLRSLLALFKVEKKLKDEAEQFKDIKPMDAQFCLRAFESVNAVIDEAEALAGGRVPLNEFIKILKSGFAAMKISLIPPKADAVFVGDLAATANMGSDVVFAARLTEGVPGASSDTALLTDRDIAVLSEMNLDISPKIQQVNARKREMCALNICAFRKHLYLSYPANLGGEECAASEIISYASAIFLAPSGNRLMPISTEKIERSLKAAPYYCSEPLPAIKRLQKFRQNIEASSVYEVLKNHGYGEAAENGLKRRIYRPITCGKRLYLSYGSLSPTALESYFSCPYLGFMRQGLKVKEREEGCVRPVDTGNFIHSVLQDVAAELADIDSDEALRARAGEIAAKKLEKPPYSSLTQSKSGQYTAEVLVKEAVEVSSGMYEQLANSTFRVLAAETKCEIELGGVKLYGRIDRVDESGDMVRIIDYKTGTVDASAPMYYTGLKLQLPLYLSAVSDGRRAAGAYYFPAAVEYAEKKDGVFRLQGFMDGSEEVIAASDKTVAEGKKSKYVNAYFKGKNIESTMTREEFGDFLSYSRLVAGGGAKEFLEGNIKPSPAEGTCAYCPVGGSCGFAAGKSGEERKAPSVKCSTVAAIAQKAREKGNE